MKFRIGIRREDKNQWEKRVPLIPSHVKELILENSLEIWLHPSSIRIFSDEDYKQIGARIEEDLSPCPVIFAIKEIPLSFLEKGKVYVFFSHTTKGQPHNMPMLKKMIELECTLIDYEKIADGKNRRLLFFGRQAGLAGMLETLWTLGQRILCEKIENPFSSIKRAFEYKSLVDAKEEIKQVGWKIHNEGLPPPLIPLICGFAGYGNVSQGAQEIFDLLPFEEISPEKISSFFREKNYAGNRLYKTVFKEEHMVEPISSESKFDLQDYYDNPQKYKPVFESYLEYLTVLVNCIYWEPKYPKFVTKKFLKKIYGNISSPRLRVIGDITCDIDGSVECTVKATSPDNPVFTYNPLEERAVDGIEGRGLVVMSVDNLPAEIAFESSVSFSKALKPFVYAVASADYNRDFAELQLPDEVNKAVILYRGKFTSDYLYMRNF
ncbi:MAG: bifunctional lysine ketoglutarate reductase /saccharopine dehydrogenase family protein [Candidatus Aminicenantaceae bacterium]